MRGYPKKLNTKEDYEYVREHFPEEQWRQDWQNLLDTERDWVATNIVDANHPAVLDATHKVVEEDDDDEEAEEQEHTLVEYELQVIPTCRMFRLGFTEEYVKSVLGED